ncbi:hypothetical protein [Amycolatopsis sp. GM8]|uniref:hypothetical protein n=1 Tax=Amycolatopsis sp. GM8 TaxID=2896530 RepID=UPI001F3F4707|nr:hypothetical protein [Amycolatopsis sp. GM8]
MREVGPVEWLLLMFACVAFAALVTALYAVARFKLDRMLSRSEDKGTTGDRSDQRHHTGRRAG